MILDAARYTQPPTSKKTMTTNREKHIEKSSQRRTEKSERGLKRIARPVQAEFQASRVNVTSHDVEDFTTLMVEQFVNREQIATSDLSYMVGWFVHNQLGVIVINHERRQSVSFSANILIRTVACTSSYLEARAVRQRRDCLSTSKASLERARRVRPARVNDDKLLAQLEPLCDLHRGIGAPAPLSFLQPQDLASSGKFKNHRVMLRFFHSFRLPVPRDTNLVLRS